MYISCIIPEEIFLAKIWKLQRKNNFEKNFKLSSKRQPLTCLWSPLSQNINVRGDKANQQFYRVMSPKLKLFKAVIDREL